MAHIILFKYKSNFETNSFENIKHLIFGNKGQFKKNKVIREIK